MGTVSSQSQGVTLCRLSMPHVRAGEATHYGLLFPICRVAESLPASLSLLFPLASPLHPQGYSWMLGLSLGLAPAHTIFSSQSV